MKIVRSVRLIVDSFRYVDHDTSFSFMSFDSIEQSEDISHSTEFRVMIIFQIISYGSYSILIHLCEKDNMVAFSSVTMNLAIEFIKLFISLSAFIYFVLMNTDIHLPKMQILSMIRESLPYSIPGMLYFLNNNLAVHIQVQMDPISYQVLSNFKILATAILYRLIIKYKLTRLQWFALSLLFFSGIIYGFGTYISFIVELLWHRAEILSQESLDSSILFSQCKKRRKLV